jgi:hypothetical protein
VNALCDTNFAYAVRRAAIGIRLKAGADDIVEAGPLCAFLCSDRELDQHGLDLMALAVTGKLRKAKTPQRGETEFAEAVRRASAVWRAGKANSPSVTGDALAYMLRSGQPPLGAGERQELAELFSPQLPDIHNVRKGRPPKGSGHSDVVAVVKMLRCELEKGDVFRKNAILDTAKEFRISSRTVEHYEAITKKREAAIIAAHAPYEPLK